MEKKLQILHSLFFLKGKEGLKISYLKNVFNLSEKKIINLIEELKIEFKEKGIPFVIKRFEDIYWIKIDSKISLEISQKLKKEIKVKLSNNLLDTLTIIAYNQPISKTGVERIKNSSCEYAFMKLLTFDLIEEDQKFHEDKKIRSKVYKTTPYFLILFDLETLNDLPKYEKDFKEKTEEIDLLDYNFSSNSEENSESL